MKTDHTLTGDQLRELVEYRPDGSLWWREQTHHAQRVDKPLGSPAGKLGRLQCQIAGAHRYVHRLVWLYHRNEWPAGQIDHINGDPHDNRIENLRVVNNAQNSRNRRHRGVSFDRRKAARPWRARIMLDGRSISLGYYDTEAEAMAEYERAKLHYHPTYRTGIAAST